jgi:hypothetical protein
MRQLILDHLDDNEWKYSALTEKLLRLPSLWLGSVVDQPMVPVAGQAHLTPNETTVELQSRPLTAAGQHRLFSRIIGVRRIGF